MKQNVFVSLMLVVALYLYSGNAQCASLLFSGNGHLANEETHTGNRYDLDGDGYPEIVFTEDALGFTSTTITASNLDSTVLWTKEFIVSDYCPSCDFGSFTFLGFGDVEDLAGREALISWSGSDTTAHVWKFGIFLYSPSSSMTTTNLDSAYADFIGDFNGDGWDEMHVNYSSPNAYFEIWGHSSTVGVGEATNTPSMIKQIRNRPNPFNPITNIEFSIPRMSDVSIEVHEVSGRLVRLIDLGILQSGSHTAKWNGFDDRGFRCASGQYFYTVKAGDEKQTRKMTLLR